jgi:hypothetical protein
VGRALRRIFGPKRDEATGGWRKLHNVEFNHFDSSSRITRPINQKLRSARYVVRTLQERNPLNILV